MKSNYFTRDGFTTSEVVISVALLSAFYASILTISSLVTSSSRSSEIRPALDQVITSDIEYIRNSSWAYLYAKKISGENCYLTDPNCPPNRIFLEHSAAGMELWNPLVFSLLKSLTFSIIAKQRVMHPSCRVMPNIKALFQLALAIS